MKLKLYISEIFAKVEEFYVLDYGKTMSIDWGSTREYLQPNIVKPLLECSKTTGFKEVR